jgi:HD-GYP domain-containing protein (c-di-GMP phosphodiesterase class II)/HAMP domain-containing protein
MKRIEKIRNSIYRTSLYRLYGNLKIKYKLTIYFTIFGIIIAAFSFLVFRTVATYNFNKIAALMVRSSLEQSDLPGDFISGISGDNLYTDYRETLPFRSVLENEIFVNNGVIWFKVYYSENGSEKWQELIFPRGEVTGFKPAADVPFREENAFVENGVYSFSPLSVLWGRYVSVWINLTRNVDKHRYLMELRLSRKGIVELVGGMEVVTAYSLLIAAFAFMLSHWISRFIARPVRDLNRQAALIASGDFTVKTKQLHEDEIGELSGSLNLMADKIGGYINDLSERMKSIAIMNRIDKAVLATVSRKDLIYRVTSFVSELFSECTVTLVMEEAEKERYHLLTHFEKGVAGKQQENTYVYFSDLGEKIVRNNRSFYSVSMTKDPGMLNFTNTLLKRRFYSFMNIPIILDDAYQGSLIVGKDIDVPFTDSQEQILRALADQVGVAMKSLRFLEEKDKLYSGILEALSKTIDAKSRWTGGHSSRVSLYSDKIASKAGLEEEFAEDLKIAAALHDIGKIGVPELLLDKPGRLTDDEFGIIKSHPESGAAIIESIPGYDRFIKGVLFHHEHWDGSGYPYGLSGESIPLMARILTAADIYDAIKSDRPYRRGMGHKEALTVLNYEKRRKLDPDIADILIGIIADEQWDKI